ncbi:MAG TPA: metallopeptidase TldD-related protein [Chloroflexota bacterium]|nr:metallopeptidase TldD-related protein [Chloroflexota bacterium]
MTSGEERLLTLLEDAVKRSGADQTEIVAQNLVQGVSRYAGSTIHQTSELRDTRVWARAVVGKSVGRAAGNSLEPAELRRLVEEATATARIQQPNPDFRSLPEPEPVRSVAGYDAATAEMDPAGRAEAIGIIAGRAAERGWTAAGTYLTEGRELAVVSSLGVSAYAPGSLAFLRALPDSGEGTGYADALSHRAADLDAADVAERALAICALNRERREVPPGEYEAIFSDLCVAEALFYLATRGFDGRGYEEGQSFLSGRLGERVTGKDVTIWDDGTDPRGLAVASDYEGVPKRKVPLIEQGVARNVAYDSYTAHRAGKRSNGFAPNPDFSWGGPAPSNLFMAGGDATVDEMIRSTRRGLLLTRFHYTHGPDPKRVVMTGTTRDGTFLIENGEIAAAVKNLRLTQSVPELFEGIELAGTPRLCRDWWCSNGMGGLSYVCPPL